MIKQGDESMFLNPSPRALPSENAVSSFSLNYCTSKFLRIVHAPGSVIHVFVKQSPIGSDQHFVGYYDTDNLDTLQQDVQPYSGHATGIYYGLNPVSPSCLDRAKNCLMPVTQAASATNSDIHHRGLMLIDIDPVREPNCSATNEEKDVAYWLGRTVFRDLRKAGWPKPIVVDSGNGYHLLFKVDLPAGDEDLIRNCLRALASRYDCEEVTIDTGVFDARRIEKLPGTMACKGQSTHERPHRKSGFFSLPTDFKPVAHQLLHDLADQAPAIEKLDAPKKPTWIQFADESTQVARARSYLAKMPPAVDGQGGRNHFLNAACRLVDDSALPREQALPLLEEYNQRCVPPFDESGVTDKLSSALAIVAERGGPSGSALTVRQDMQHQEKSKRAVKFAGFVPDFGLASKADTMALVDRKFVPGFWVWYCLLWRSLRSDVNVSDVMLRQWHWGADYDRNWKARLQKKVGLKAAKKTNCTADTCMLFNTGITHNHYYFRPDKYGQLDAFCSPEERKPGCLRVFDVYGEKYKEGRKKLQKSGKLFNVYWPALVLGNSRRVGWSWPQQRLVVGMVLELTRTTRKAGQDIAGEIVTGGLVPVSKDSSRKAVCPLLDPNEEYVSFAGNGKRKGRGYQLVGRTGKGWIHRAGYLNALQMNEKERVDGLRSFLKDLEILSEDLGLIPAAILHGTWKNIDEMIDCTRTGRGRDWLDGCTMRVYAPADWRHRWRKFFSEKLGFEWIPASPDDSDASLDSDKPLDPQQITSANQVKKWLKDSKWTQQRLAEEIASVTGKECSLRRVQRHLGGKSCTRSFFEDVDRVKAEGQKATPKVTNQD